MTDKKLDDLQQICSLMIRVAFSEQVTIIEQAFENIVSKMIQVNHENNIHVLERDVRRTVYESLRELLKV